MRSYAVHEARADLSKVMDRALSGEPQRVTRRGRDAVVIVSEADWARLSSQKPTLAEILTRHAGEEGYAGVLQGQPWGGVRAAEFDHDE
jgi:prevent-host-death family protein